jgi:hypothetical protein
VRSHPYSFVHEITSFNDPSSSDVIRIDHADSACQRPHQRKLCPVLKADLLNADAVGTIDWPFYHLCPALAVADAPTMIEATLQAA